MPCSKWEQKEWKKEKRKKKKKKKKKKTGFKMIYMMIVAKNTNRRLDTAALNVMFLFVIYIYGR
jgi:hypothetical protein